MEQALKQIVAKIAETSIDFQLNANLHDELNVDSIRALEIMFEIERQFGVHIPEGRYSQVRSFSDLMVLVQSLKH
ncbi:MAG TPA: acyl carrier protein [Anaeromyxobacteraceae bacterium]|nr:acyl carrier protein [Anaeromyxobacteraceae bacterium]